MATLTLALFPAGLATNMHLQAAKDVQGALPLAAAGERVEQAAEGGRIRLAAPAAHELENLQAALPAPTCRASPGWQEVNRKVM